MLLSSAKFDNKAGDVLRQDLEGEPRHVKLEKKFVGGALSKVTLEGQTDGSGGMMLYTSGTTNRPVSLELPVSYLHTKRFKERSIAPTISSYSSSKISRHSMELLS